MTTPIVTTQLRVATNAPIIMGAHPPNFTFSPLKAFLVFWQDYLWWSQNNESELCYSGKIHSKKSTVPRGKKNKKNKNTYSIRRILGSSIIYYLV